MEILKRMDAEETERYKTYYCEKWKKQRTRQYLFMIIWQVVMVIAFFVMREAFIREWIPWVIVLLCIAAFVFLVVISEKQAREFADAEGLCEYAIVTEKLDKKCQILRENGDVVTYAADSRTPGLKKGDPFVVVYVPQIKKVCIETVADWSRLGFQGSNME